MSEGDPPAQAFEVPSRSRSIACIGWGSLLWDPRTLPMAGAFRSDGPMLPIEFSRVASDGRVTLVIDSDAAEIQTYWCPLAVDSLEDAIEALRVREKIPAERSRNWVGAISRESTLTRCGDTPTASRDRIEAWLSSRELDAVVWTALPRRTPDGRFGPPTEQELIVHMGELEGSARERAEEYIRRAPNAVRTPRRKRFEALFPECCATA